MRMEEKLDKEEEKSPLKLNPRFILNDHHCIGGLWVYGSPSLLLKQRALHDM
jgi:hypothetical protein